MWILGLLYMRKIVILGTGLNRAKKPGMAIPAIVMYEQMSLLDTGCEFKILGFENTNHARAHASIIKSSDIIIINSLSTLLNDAGGQLLNLLKSKKIYLYLHETEFVLEYSDLQNPQRMTAFWKSLPYMGLLCSTEQQRLFYQKLGLKNTAVIYNSLNLNPSYTWRRKRVLGDVVRVVMIGSIQKRKGNRLFDQVANILSKSDRQYKFTWIGDKTNREDGNYQFTKCVEWVERVSAEEIYDVYLNADVFFLSSVDDPLPLSATEAAASGLRIVAYEKTGTYEILSDCTGFVSFSDYSPECAAEAIEKAIEDFPDKTDYTNISRFFTPTEFARRAWYEISKLESKIPIFKFEPEQFSLDYLLDVIADGGCSPRLIAYSLPLNGLMEQPDQLSRLRSKLNLNKVMEVADKYRVSQLDTLHGLEITCAAKLFLICEKYKRAIDIVIYGLSHGVTLNSGLIITNLALDNMQLRQTRANLLGNWILPMTLKRLKSTKNKAILYDYAAKLFRKEGYCFIAERFANRV